jgi:chromosome segregation ATPase
MVDAERASLPADGSRGGGRAIMSKNPESPLLAAARQLDEDLSRFDALSSELSRTAINSEKSLQRARQVLESCTAHETKLAQSLGNFAQAMQTVQQIQHACMDVTGQAAKRIAERHAERLQLQDRLARLGEGARAASAPVAEMSELGATTSSQMLEPLGEVERRLEAVIAEAGEVCALAEQGDWTDLQRDTQSLREQLQGLRNRILLARRKLGSDAPS